MLNPAPLAPVVHDSTHLYHENVVHQCRAERAPQNAPAGDEEAEAALHVHVCLGFVEVEAVLLCCVAPALERSQDAVEHLVGSVAQNVVATGQEVEVLTQL